MCHIAAPRRKNQFNFHHDFNFFTNDDISETRKYCDIMKFVNISILWSYGKKNSDYL